MGKPIVTYFSNKVSKKKILKKARAKFLQRSFYKDVPKTLSRPVINFYFLRLKSQNYTFQNSYI